MDKKIIDKWKDTYHGITSTLYRYENGVRLLVCVNPLTRRFDLHVVMRGGAYYERNLGVPRGSMHLLEHVMAGQPNKKFKSKRQIDEYLLGTRNRPSMYKNAFTGLDTIGFEGSIAADFSDRLLNFVLFRLDYPEANLDKYIEEERQVVLTEAGSHIKPEESEGFQSEQFARKESYQDLNEFTIGNTESIQSITSEHLRTCIQAIRNPHGTVITVQVPERPSPHTQKLLSKLAEVLSGEQQQALPNPVIEQVPRNYRIGYFRDRRAREVSMAIYALQPRQMEVNYKRSQLNSFANQLVKYVGTQLLRRELNLVYGFNFVSSNVLLHWNNKGLKTEFTLEIMPKVLDGIQQLLDGKLIEFLHSTKGKRWLNSQISDYLFPGNPKYDYHYAYDLGNEILDGEKYKFNYRQAYRTVKTTKSAEIADRLHENILDVAPQLWISGNYEPDALLEVYRSSGLHKSLEGKWGEPDVWLAPNARPDA